MEVHIVEPLSISGNQLSEFHDRVLEGKQVDPIGLMGRIRAGFLLGFFTEGGRMVSVAGMKKPRRSVFGKAGVPELYSNFRFEIGWAYTDPAFQRRGLSIELHRQLLERAGTAHVYATVECENEAPNGMLPKLGFIQIGCQYGGRKQGKQITLFARDLSPIANNG